MLGSLEGLGARYTNWESVPSAEKFEVRLFPQTDGKQPFSPENSADYMRMRCINTSPYPSSTTTGAHSASTTAVPHHAAITTPNTYRRPATNQPDPYATSTASGLYYGSTPSRPPMTKKDIFVCDFPDA